MHFELQKEETLNTRKNMEILEGKITSSCFLYMLFCEMNKDFISKKFALL